MSRVASFLQNFSQQFLPSKTQVFLDLGSGSAKFYLQGKEVFREPTRVVVQSQSSEFISRRMKKNYSLGQGDAVVKNLVERGSITDYELARDFLNKLLRKFVEENKVEPRFYGIYLLPSSATQVDELIISKVLDDVDYGRWRLVRKSHAAQHLKGCIIDIGFDLTEVILDSRRAKTIRFGSKSFTKKIREIVRDKYHLDVSWQVAEKIKLELKGENFLLSDSKQSQKISVRGKDVHSFVPKTVIIESKDLQKGLVDQVEDLFDEIKLFFSKVSADLLMNSIERGLVLWGDGSKMAGLENYLATKLQTEVNRGEAFYKI